MNARSVELTKDTTTIIEGKGSQDAIKARVQQIRKQIENTTSDYDQKNSKSGLQNLQAVLQLLELVRQLKLK